MSVRTRIAPSPTGNLHIGHFRTVLYNYAFAKKQKGQFVVRIEDTDRKRYVEGALDRTLDVIGAYGLSWDEGPRVGGPYAPYIQSECLDRYKDFAHKLVAMGKAYYCFCNEERLAKLREDQQKAGAAKTKYDKFCRNLDTKVASKKVESGEKFVIRLKAPENEQIILTDLIHGEVIFNTSDVDDPILLKSDGFPTYHLAVVIDDHLMNITHVLRGIDWMPSSPIHILLYKAFGWELPLFGHLPNVKEKGANKKLGKRFGSVSAWEFLQEGYLPESIMNLLMFVGWNPGTEKELYSLEEFVNDFSVERIQKTDLVAFDREKLLWFNGYYIRNLAVDSLWDKIVNWSNKFDVKLFAHDFPDDFNIRVLKLVQDRLKILSEFNKWTQYFYTDPEVSKESLVEFTQSDQQAKEIIKTFLNLFRDLNTDDWVKDTLDKKCHTLLEEFGYKPKEAFMTIRLAITGDKATPPLFDVLELLGKSTTLKRLEAAQKTLS